MSGILLKIVTVKHQPKLMPKEAPFHLVSQGTAQEFTLTEIVFH